MTYNDLQKLQNGKIKQILRPEASDNDVTMSRIQSTKFNRFQLCDSDPQGLERIKLSFVSRFYCTDDKSIAVDLDVVRV